MVVLLPESEAAPDGDVPVVETEPDPDDEQYGDVVELVRSGMVRIRIGGDRWRLRRPFFGELRTLRIAWENVADELADEAQHVQAVAVHLRTEKEALDADETKSPEDRAAAVVDLNRRDRAAGRALNDKGDELRIGWWRQAFDVLSVEHPVKAPDDMPAWFASNALPARILAHWRSVPLARG